MLPIVNAVEFKEIKETREEYVESLINKNINSKSDLPLIFEIILTFIVINLLIIGGIIIFSYVNILGVPLSIYYVIKNIITNYYGNLSTNIIEGINLGYEIAYSILLPFLDIGDSPEDRPINSYLDLLFGLINHLIELIQEMLGNELQILSNQFLNLKEPVS
jgi:hypothetical protein